MITKLTGTLTDKFPVETPTPNFSKQVLWVKQPDTERYPQHWQIEVHNDDIKHLSKINVFHVVECEVEVRGRQFTNRSGQKQIMTTLKLIGIKIVQ